ncbi:MAG TPA: GNAT family N-acetyltransferase [Pseudoxanthomonas sp.]|nr:GNAT family N-acetyltransferase [Pseudoxanthomonas sp.]
MDDFQCTSPDLAKWLIDRARKNHREGASRWFVVCGEQQNVVGYYALAAGAVSHEQVPGRVKRNMPDPIPVAVLGRLAVHAEWAGKGIGRGLLKDAVQRTWQTAQQMGIRVLLCHAIDESAKAFYIKHGFIESPVNPMTVMLSMTRLSDEIRETVRGR